LQFTANDKRQVGKQQLLIWLQLGRFRKKKKYFNRCRSSGILAPGLGIDVENVAIGTYQILEPVVEDGELYIEHFKYDIIPAHIDLVCHEIELVDKGRIMSTCKQALQTIRENRLHYYRLPASLGLLTLVLYNDTVL
jgi:chromosome partitioning protein